LAPHFAQNFALGEFEAWQFPQMTIDGKLCHKIFKGKDWKTGGILCHKSLLRMEIAYAELQWILPN
jgi:hypothetical protein